ncbi:MAG: hypothetical protein RIF41_22880, partial [Polyangiaceae bacterium]
DSGAVVASSKYGSIAPPVPKGAVSDTQQGTVKDAEGAEDRGKPMLLITLGAAAFIAAVIVAFVVTSGSSTVEPTSPAPTDTPEPEPEPPTPDPLPEPVEPPVVTPAPEPTAEATATATAVVPLPKTPRPVPIPVPIAPQPTSKPGLSDIGPNN